MPETLWDELDKYRKSHNYSTHSGIIQQSVQEFLNADVTEKNYRIVDIITVALIFVVILLLLVVIL